MGTGLGWRGSTKDKSQLTEGQRIDALALAEIVDFCVKTKLETLSVSSDEIRILKRCHRKISKNYISFPLNINLN
jgi:hypothetical protein